MSLIKSMAMLIKLSQIFGVFPYKVTFMGDFCSLEVSKPRMRYTIILFWILFLLGGSSAFSLALIFPFKELASRLILTLSSLALYVNFIVVFRIVVKKSDILCFWLNKINDMFESIPPANDSFHEMTGFNRNLVVVSSTHMLILATSEIGFGTIPAITIAVGLVSFVRLFIVHIFLVQFIVLVNSVRVFYKINHLNVSRKRKSRVPALFWVKTLQNLMKMDLIVKDFVENLHSIHIPVLSIAFMWGFFSLLCAIALGSRVGMSIMTMVQWITLILLEISLPTVVCHLASSEANKMVSSLQEIFIDLNNAELLFQVETFSLQLQHRQLEFKIFDSLKLNCGLLYSMAGATWTYSIIVLQFQEQQVSQIYVNSTNASNIFI